MTARLLLTTAALACAVASIHSDASAQEQRFGTVTSVQLPKGLSLKQAALGDVDGDGRDDLVLCARRGGKRPGRLLRVHLRRAQGAAFEQEPDASYELPEDVSAFGIADLDPEPGAEIALFTSGSVWAWRTRAAEERGLVKLLETSFLWQMADPREAFVWDGSFRDVDGDGLTDLVIPEPGAVRIALQRRAEGASKFLPVSVLDVPGDAEGDATEPAGARRLRAKAERKRITIAIQIGDEGDGAPRDLLSVTESVPAPQVLDFDGDGRADVLAQTRDALHVWRQREGGTFAAAPDASYAAPVAADRKRRLDVSYSALAADIDGDRRADAVYFAGDKNASDTRTQVLVFSQKGAGREASPLFGADGIPNQLLKLAGFAGSPRLVDVDGDGLPDLTVGVVRVDGLDAISAAAKGTIDAELLVFRNLGGTFSKSPALSHTIAFRAEGFRKTNEQVLARFVADVTGDRVRDLLVRDQPGRLRLFMVRRQGESLSILAQPLWETVVPEDARVVLRERAGASAEALILEDDQVRHVRWP